MDNGASSYRRFLNGDNDAIAEIINEYRGGLEFFLMSIVGDEYTAEELTQDTFAHLFIKKPKYKPTASFKTWLYTIAKNNAYKHLKRRSRNMPLTDEIAVLIPDELKTLEEKYFSDTKKLNVIDVMSKLKSEYREVLWLTYFEEMSNKECAEIMGKSVHNIEVLVSRARQALKKLLQEEGYNHENQ